jgi:hypothetical protein
MEATHTHSRGDVYRFTSLVKAAIRNCFTINRVRACADRHRRCQSSNDGEDEGEMHCAMRHRISKREWAQLKHGRKTATLYKCRVQ